MPTDLEPSVLTAAVAEGWGFAAVEVEYAPVGGGSYHWLLRDGAGARRFLTVDRLDRKAWLGDTCDAAWAGLRRAFETSLALRDTGLRFVVAPLPGLCGEALRRLGPSHAIALFPFVDGVAGRWGHYDHGAREALLSLLAELHLATPSARSATPVGLGLPGRRRLDAALRELNRTWTGGPFSEPARRALGAHASDVTDLIALADRLAASVAARGGTFVVTHGEPHPGNLMRTGAGYRLVDWDTVALAPPERDLWMLVEGSASDVHAYTEATGHELDQAAVDFFRLAWDLKDLAEYLNALRATHSENEDTTRAYEGLRHCVSARERWQSLLG